MMQSYIRKAIEVLVPVDPDNMDVTFRVMQAVSASTGAMVASLPPGCVTSEPMEMVRHKADAPVPTPAVFLTDSALPAEQDNSFSGAGA